MARESLTAARISWEENLDKSFHSQINCFSTWIDFPFVSQLFTLAPRVLFFVAYRQLMNVHVCFGYRATKNSSTNTLLKSDKIDLQSRSAGENHKAEQIRGCCPLRAVRPERRRPPPPPTLGHGSQRPETRLNPSFSCQPEPPQCLSTTERTVKTTPGKATLSSTAR